MRCQETMSFADGVLVESGSEMVNDTKASDADGEVGCRLFDHDWQARSCRWPVVHLDGVEGVIASLGKEDVCQESGRARGHDHDHVRRRLYHLCSSGLAHDLECVLGHGPARVLQLGV